MTKESAYKPNLNHKGFTPLVTVLIVAALIGVGYLGYKIFITKSNNPSQPTLQKTPQKSATTSAKIRSKALGIVTQILLTKNIDPKTGAAVNSTTTFSKTDPTIYVVVSLKNPPIGTKVEYVRYLNDKFLDNRSTATTKASDNSVIFDWILKKPGATRLVGNYKVKVFTNGVFEKEISYIIQ